jgi:glycosyltransferase involved in cell wall biosynthesis
MSVMPAMSRKEGDAGASVTHMPARTPKLKYVVAHNGARDHYQLALALAERARLETLVTDFYAPDWLRRLAATPGRVAARHVEGLSSAKTTSCLDLFLLQAAARGLRDKSRLHEHVDRALGERAAERSRMAGDHGLFLYSGYALESFQNARPGQPKILFYFHPHHALATEILAADAERYPRFADFRDLDSDLRSTRQNERRDRELALADRIVCASEFTRRSLIFAGASAERVFVAPYGGETSAAPVETRRRKRFLFVGQGVQRKGLHHLLEAWDRAKLKDARLDVVAYRVDPHMTPPRSDNVRLHGYLRPKELRALFHSASFFVLPSLVEGFGLVYLEALAAGCICVGTQNSGLPDLDLGEASIIAEPGSPDSLRDALSRCDEAYAKGVDHASIAALARSRDWATFRKRVVAIVDSLEGAES